MALTNSSYATTTDLATYLGVTVNTLTATDQRYLYRASELIFALTGGQYAYANAALTTEPYPSIVRAVCAQVEYWRTNGEGVDTEIATTGESIGKYSVQYAGGQGSGPRRLAPRAFDTLQAGGALYGGVVAK